MSELHVMFPSLNASSTLHIWEAEIQIDVFVDSGNSCTEPLSGAPVHFVSLKVLERLYSRRFDRTLSCLGSTRDTFIVGVSEAIKKNYGLIRLVTVQGQSWAVGFKFDQWVIGGR